MKNSEIHNMIKQCESVSGILKSLAHPVRLKLLCYLIDNEKSVNDLTDFCSISQSAMSQFLQRMKAEGVLSSRKEGTSVYYRLSDPQIKKLIRSLKEIYCP